MSGKPPLRVSRQGRVLTLVIDTPESRNAVSPALSGEIVAAVADANADARIGALILTGEGTVFSAGGDIGALAASLRNPAPAAEQRAAFQSSIAAALALADSAKPVIAAINGACAGGGLGLAAACDIRISAERAKFAYAYPHVGLAGDFAVNWSLSRILGPARARYFCLLSEVLNAKAALQTGLVHEVVADAELSERARQLAQRLAAMSSIALAQIKRNLDAAAALPRALALEAEAEHFLIARAHPHHGEAVMAFLEKRAPVFPT